MKTSFWGQKVECLHGLLRRIHIDSWASKYHLVYKRTNCQMFSYSPDITYCVTIDDSKHYTPKQLTSDLAQPFFDQTFYFKTQPSSCTDLEYVMVACYIL